VVTTLLLLIGIVAILVAAYLFVWKKPRRARASHGPDGPVRGPEPDQDLSNLKPGDVVALWSGREALVERVVHCQETLSGRVTRWDWVFLQGGQLLATTPSGNVLYADTVVLHQGTAPFEQLTGEVERGGVLKTFEARVRAGTIGSDPVFFEHEGQRYRVQSTGTFAVPDQPVPETEVWSDVQADEGQNVYFKLIGMDGTQVLGIWTSHIALLFGRTLVASDVREVYRAGR
jgi:hypothetical protein